MLLLALAGIVLSGYLLANHFGVGTGVCNISPTVDCDKVNGSPYSVVLGVPVALIGLLGFAAMFAVGYMGRFYGDTWIGERHGKLLVLLAAIGAAFGVYLTYIELFVILAVCPFCVAAFAVNLSILALAALFLR